MRILVELAALSSDRSEEIFVVLDKARGIIDPENVSASVVPGPGRRADTGDGAA